MVSLICKFNWVNERKYGNILINIIIFITFIFIKIWLCSDNPATHRYINPREKEYLLKELGQLEQNDKGPTPWRSIFHSKPAMALIVAYVCIFVDIL